MDRFNVVVDWLWGCAHRRTTFPMTPRASGGPEQSSSRSDTYIVCLECGRHFDYDWTTMRIVKRRTAWVAGPALVPVLAGTRRGSR